MNSALTSLAASQLGLSVASNNISNAQTPGYTRERLLLAPSAIGAGPYSPGDGVDVVGIQAIRDQLTSARLNTETSYKAADDTLQQKLQDIQGWFDDTQGTGLLSEMTAFFNSFQTLSLDPTSSTNREAVRQAAQALIGAFHSQAANLDDQKQLANNAVATDVDKINTLTTQIAALTKQIQEQEVSGAPQNELRDQRSALVNQLSQIVDVRELDSTNTPPNSYMLSLAGSGQTLVVNGTSQQLTAEAGANGIYAVKADNNDLTTAIGGGDLKAQLQLRDQLIPNYAGQLDQLAYEITQQVNAIHSGATDLDGNTGINFFNPLTGASGAAESIGLSAQVAASSRQIAASQSGATGDNAAAIAIGNLLNQPVFSGGSVTDQYGALVFNVGNDAANAQSGSQEHGALQAQLQNKLQSTSGVSIDEETVQILQFQRSFQASAKLISTVDQMLQTALNMTSSTGQ
jgi:flagellar hook-associated protein 1 FlgK